MGLPVCSKPVCAADARANLFEQIIPTLSPFPLNLMTTNRLKCVALLALAALFCAPRSQASEHDYTQYVNPYIGTGGHGHVFLGANVPFGYVQLGPTQPVRGWDWCSGYHYSDSIIIGFAHTHMSGTGIGDRGDVALLPVASVEQDSVRFSHSQEAVQPGYYRLQLDNPNVTVELTATQRAGMHRYTFGSDDARPLLRLDLAQGIGFDQMTSCDFHQTSPTQIQGLRFSRGWAADQRVYFSATFSQPVTRVASSRGHIVLAAKDAHEPLLVKVGLSGVSAQNAQLNAEVELPTWDFDQVRRQATQAWNRELGRVEVSTPDAQLRTIFYTALYHCLLAPSVYNDVNGEYRGSDLQVHRADFVNHTTFSLWDTYRAHMPMMTILYPHRMPDMAQTLMRIYHEQGKLPIWHFDGNENHCMVGNPGVIVLADMVLKGLVPDAEAAYQALRTSALQTDRGLDLYDRYGYIPYNLDANANETVARALEYAIADAGVARVAQMLGHTQDAAHFLWRSQAYQRLFDPSTGFLRARDDKGQWRSDFNPLNTSHRVNDYTEGNAWQYAWLVPHDVQGLVAMYPSPQAFTAKLDSLFVLPSQLEGEDVSPDVSGLIGQYAHGNEPSHHILYIYNYLGQAHKAAPLLRQTMTSLYKNEPDGLSGNEDVGQMSAWYVLSSMGLYQADPCGGALAIGSPLFDEAKISLPQGRTFRIVAKGQSPKHCVVKRARLNGRVLKTPFITYQDVMQGGVLELEMGK